MKVAARTSQGVRLELLDGFAIHACGKLVELSLAPQRVLALVALRAKPVARNYLAGRLWLDATEKHAQGSLRSAIWKLQNSDVPLVRSSRNCLQLHEGVQLDVRAQLALALRLLEPQASSDEPKDYSLLEGELLPDWYDDWVLLERERLNQLRIHALEALARRLVQQRRYGKAAESAIRAITCDPLRESAQRTLIQVHLAEGNVSEAVRQFELYRTSLRTSLGIDPSAALRQLVLDACTEQVRSF